MLNKAKEFRYSSVIRDNAHDTRVLFRSIDKLLVVYYVDTYMRLEELNELWRVLRQNLSGW